MTSGWQRVPESSRIHWCEDTVKVRAVPAESAARHDFANLVVRQLIAPLARVAVINDRGRPAFVRCSEMLFEVLAKDHPIVGIYVSGAKVRDVMEDLEAAGL